MILCSNCEHPICDFCKHYDFNADDDGRYTGDGWCRFHSIKCEPYHECSDFHCIDAGVEDEK